jgi:2-iminoacetate synthase ThiH
MDKEMSISKSAEYLIGKSQDGDNLNREEIIQLLSLPGKYSPELFAAADKVRKEQIAFTVVCAKAIPNSAATACLKMKL